MPPVAVLMPAPVLPTTLADGRRIKDLLVPGLRSLLESHPWSEVLPAKIRKDELVKRVVELRAADISGLPHPNSPWPPAPAAD